MKKLLCLLLAVCVLLCMASCKTEAAPEEAQTQPLGKKGQLPAITDIYQYPRRPNYQLGSCKRLEANPLVVLLFMDDNESKWESAEIEEFTQNNVNVALKYLEEQAAQWDVELEFSVKSYQGSSYKPLYYRGIVETDMMKNGSTKDVLEHAARYLEYDSAWHMYSQLQNKHGDRGDVVFLTFFNKPGTTYTRHVIKPGTMTYAEHSVIFCEDSSGYMEDAAVTVACALLRQFGAESLYNGKREAIAAQLYYWDVMFQAPMKLSMTRIGDFTAYCVGWTNKAPSVCYMEDWWE